LWPRYFVLRKFVLFISVNRDHFSKMTILNEPDIEASERLIELAEILAAGLMRLQARKSSGLSGQSGENSLHYVGPQSGHAAPLSPEASP
jgi:hypothetical protein